MKKIAIIEDEPALSEMMQMMLDRSGYQTVVCDNGREAMDFLEREMPDLVMLDVMLPGMDGSEIAKNMSAHPSLSTTPIIVVSALEESGSLFRGITQVREFCPKPFTVNNLVSAVKRVLGDQ
ncbi:DNA-binding response OmpR family regulator [Elusimicrobium posterum]|uniref:response regulator transcription factor n=1 Tax=Elusimicrobium posterum TaxID=3116653 RepID=UPI003C76DBF8